MKSSLTIGLVAASITAAFAQDSITVRGSDTLGSELVPAWADAFVASGANATFDISAEGSSAAFTNLLAGTADLGMASRAAKDEEVAEATAAGNELTETVACYDMICVIVNENSPVSNLSLEQIQGIFTGEITDWSEVGGPTGEILVYTRNTSSGTYKSFQKLAMAKEEYGDNTNKMAGNQEIADEVSANEAGIGYVGMAYAGTEGVKTISVDEVAPTAENAADYAISRACYLYTNGAPEGTTAEFIEFLLSDEGDEITLEVGFIPTP